MKENLTDMPDQPPPEESVQSPASAPASHLAMLRGILKTLPAGAYTCDAQGLITYFNARAAEIWGRAPKLNDPADRYCGSIRLFSPEGLPVAHDRCWIAKALRENQEQAGPIVIERPDGDRVTVVAQSNPIRDEAGQVLGAVNVLTDVSELRRSERALRESEQRYRNVVEGSLQGILIHQDERIVYCNPALARMFGYDSCEELIGQPLWGRFATPENISMLKERTRAILAGEDIPPHPGWRAIGKDGVELWVATAASLIEWRGWPAVVAFYLDVTERKRAEEALGRLSTFREAIIRNAAEGICVCHPIDHHPYVRFSVWNDLMTAITGYTCEEINRLGWHQSMYPDENLRCRAVDRMARMREGDDLRAEEWEITRKDGKRRVVAISTSRVELEDGIPSVVALFQDLTERKRAEEARRDLEARVRHSQKLESLGVLAGGIAHDFNNLLTSMLGYSTLALMQLPADSPARPMVGEIEKAAQRASELTQQMLAYSGRGKFVIRVLRLDSLVQEMTQLLTTAISKKATLTLNLEAASIEADPTQVRQVVMNLITNASEALEGQCGTIEIRTGVRRAEAADLRSPFLPEDLPKGDYAYVRVEDSGCGMTAETLSRIFDPFFTTKFTGRGLGLAAVLGIVKGHRGTIQVDSTPGRGTAFEVLFPRWAGGADVPSRSRTPPAGARGRGLVLVVDDEVSVRGYVREVLEGVGFQVREARDGREGLDIFRRCHQEIVAVVLDLTMPRVDGVEMLRDLRGLNPDVPVFVMSGFSEHEVSGRLAGLGANGLLQKPFQPNDLISRVCSVS